MVRTLLDDCETVASKAMAVSGNVVRIGRSNDLARRASEHARDPRLRDYVFEPVHRTDSYAEQRGLEHLLHKEYNPPLNHIRPISPVNKRRSVYLEAARIFLGLE